MGSIFYLHQLDNHEQGHLWADVMNVKVSAMGQIKAMKALSIEAPITKATLKQAVEKTEFLLNDLKELLALLKETQAHG